MGLFKDLEIVVAELICHKCEIKEQIIINHMDGRMSKTCDSCNDDLKITILTKEEK